jgi:CheY-like chemotaxis protein
MNAGPVNPLVVVDDSDDDRFFARRAHRLSGLSAPLLVLDSGSALLTHLNAVAEGQECVPLAILLDINMPDLDGFATYERLVSTHGCAELPPVWFLTGSDDARDILRAERLGAAGLLTKPASVRRLARLLTDVVQQVQVGVELP